MTSLTKETPLRNLFEVAKRKGVAGADLRALCERHYGVLAPSRLSLPQINELIADLLGLAA